MASLTIWFSWRGWKHRGIEYDVPGRYCVQLTITILFYYKVWPNNHLDLSYFPIYSLTAWFTMLFAWRLTRLLVLSLSSHHSTTNQACYISHIHSLFPIVCLSFGIHLVCNTESVLALFHKLCYVNVLPNLSVFMLFTSIFTSSFLKYSNLGHVLTVHIYLISVIFFSIPLTVQYSLLDINNSYVFQDKIFSFEL
jgi:hypothetical protein